jgi:integrase
MIDEALKKQLLAKYADNLAKSKNKNHYLRFAQDFLDNAEGMDKASIDQYIAKLPTRKHYKPGSVNFAFRVISRLFSVNQYILKAMNIEWEYRQGEAPVIGQRDEYQPQLGSRTIKMMIEAAKNGKLSPNEQCFIALSTIYGLRREELANLQPADIKLRSSAIYIATVKSGRERYHLIPAEIKPYLAAHDFNERYAVATVSQMFKRILTKSGAGELRKKRLGWHAIRRAVLDGLIDNGVNVLAARAFLRWKGAGREMAMPARYFGNVIEDVGETEPVLDEAKNDEGIFEKHPFLPFWQRTYKGDKE